MGSQNSGCPFFFAFSNPAAHFHTSLAGLKSGLSMRPTLLSLALLAASCGNGENPEFRQPDDYGQVAPFELQDQSGKTFSGDTLKGKVWVVDFFFTRCPSVCPRMTLEMKKLYERMPNREDLQFVSMTIDSEFDKPDILAKYISTKQLPKERWTFLTGDKKAIADLSRKSFALALGDEMKPNGDIIHSTKFVVVDREGKIRKYFNSLDDEQDAEMEALILQLLDE